MSISGSLWYLTSVVLPSCQQMVFNCHFHVLRVPPTSAGFHEKQKAGRKLFLPCDPSDRHPGEMVVSLRTRSRPLHTWLSLLPPAQCPAHRHVASEWMILAHPQPKQDDHFQAFPQKQIGYWNHHGLSLGGNSKKRNTHPQEAGYWANDLLNKMLVLTAAAVSWGQSMLSWVSHGCYSCPSPCGWHGSWGFHCCHVVMTLSALSERAT